MKRMTWTMSAVAGLALMASAAQAVEVNCFFVSPQALPGTGQTVAEAKAGGVPIIPLANAGPNAVINWELWCHIDPSNRPAQPGYAPYLKMTGGGFNIAGPNNSVLGSSLNLFRTFNTATSQRRWDSASATSNGTGPGAGYLWMGTSFDSGVRSGIDTRNNGSGATTGANSDISPDQWKIASGTFTVGGAGVNGIGGFFDVFIEMANNSWGTAPGSPVATLSFGPDDNNAANAFLASNSLNNGHRSQHPDMRIQPEPATLALLGLGGLFIRRRRSA